MRRRYTIIGKLFLAVFIIGLIGMNTQAQVGVYKYSDSWGKQGFNISDQRSDELVVSYSIEQFSIEQEEINNKGRHQVSMPGYFLPNNEGMPNLPGTGRFIAIPNGAQVEFEIVNSRKEIIENVDVAPAPRIPLDTDNDPLFFEDNKEVYSKDAFYPESPVKLSEAVSLRGIQSVMLGVTPFQYNPVSKQLIIYRDLEVRIRYTGGDNEYGQERLRSRWWDPIIKSSVLNPEVLSQVNYSEREMQNERDNEEYEYLIISPNNYVFQQWADTIRRFRNMQGIHTGVVTLDEIGGATVNDIEGYINDIYENWTYPPAAVLLLGDYGANSGTSITSPIYDNYCVSDNIYADVDEDDLPDIVFARMTAQNEEQLKTMVTKFINYETNPPMSEDFYNHPITALGWQTQRWFQICSESVGGFWKNELGKDPVRINAVYEGNPNTDPWSTAQNTLSVLNYFGPDGQGYIPSSPSALGGFSGGTPEDITTAINAGSFMLQHRDHGFEEGWGEPAYTNSDINGLTNTDLTYIFSINCLTGKYNHSSESFAEKFHRYTNNGENSGALGIMAASQISYSFVNDTYVWGMYDYMWQNFLPDYAGEFQEEKGMLPAFASVYGKYYLEQSDWPNNPDYKDLTYHLFHHHGDAFLNVYSEVPQELSVFHSPVHINGMETFSVNADEGSLIALSVDGELMSTAEGTGTGFDLFVDNLAEGTIIDVVVTKKNHIRYHEQVLVVPADGPYVIQHAFDFNDEQGNANGLPDYNESLLLNLTVKNVGTVLGENIHLSLSSESEFITFLDSTEEYGVIGASETELIEGAFQFTISDNIPDQTPVEIMVTATDGAETWESVFSFRVHAPVFEIVAFSLEEISGDYDGYLDQGETAMLSLTAQNTGHSSAFDVLSQIDVYPNVLSIENSQDGSELLEPGQATVYNFMVTADSNTPYGTMVQVANVVNSGIYTASRNYTIKVGVPVETWESGDLNQFDWENDVNIPWTIATDSVYQGDHSLKSGAISHDGMTELIISYTSMQNDTISFFKKVSSELNFDALKFYIDGTEKGEWSGSSDWSREVFYVPAGTHTFRWEYTKDGSMSHGKDCAWIDQICLPVEQMTTCFAGVDINGCPGDSFEMQAQVTHYTSALWSTEGTGAFDNETSLNAVYTPSDSDLGNGFVILKLTVQGVDGDVIIDELQIQFLPSIVLSIDENLSVCLDGSLDLNPLIENYETVLWNTMGDGSFENTEAVSTTYIPGSNDLLIGQFVISLEVESPESCEIISKDILVQVQTTPEQAGVISGDESVDVYTNDSSVYSIDEIDFAESYHWTISPEEAGEILVDGSELTVVWNQAFTDESITVSVFASNECGVGSASEIHVTTNNTTGEVERGLMNFNLYPNPAQEKVRLSLELKKQQDIHLSIINNTGSRVYSHEFNNVKDLNHDIHLDRFASGVYYVVIYGNDVNTVVKLIVE